MGQDNAAAVVPNEIASGMQRAQPVRDLPGGEAPGEVVRRRGAAIAGQLAVDEQPEVFDDVGREGIGGHAAILGGCRNADPQFVPTRLVSRRRVRGGTSRSKLKFQLSEFRR